MKLVLTEETRERELCAQDEVLVRCRCVLPKLQPLSARAQRRLERYITELERRWNGACEGWLLEQAAEGVRLARSNALPFAPLEAVLDFETTWLDDRFWSVLWRWQVTWQGESVLLRRWGLGARDALSGGAVSAGEAEGTAEILAEAPGCGTGSGGPRDGVAAWAGVVYFDGGGTGLRVAKTCKSCNCF